MNVRRSDALAFFGATGALPRHPACLGRSGRGTARHIVNPALKAEMPIYASLQSSNVSQEMR
jgi:hypothetical protein